MSTGMKCFLCGKGRMVGRSHKHHPGVAGGRWKKRAPKTQKIFKPNLHSARILVEGSMKRVRLCTKCLRRVKKSEIRMSKSETNLNKQNTNVQNVLSI